MKQWKILKNILQTIFFLIFLCDRCILAFLTSLTWKPAIFLQRKLRSCWAFSRSDILYAGCRWRLWRSSARVGNSHLSELLGSCVCVSSMCVCLCVCVSTKMPNRALCHLVTVEFGARIWFGEMLTTFCRKYWVKNTNYCTNQFLEDLCVKTCGFLCSNNGAAFPHWNICKWWFAAEFVER